MLGLLIALLVGVIAGVLVTIIFLYRRKLWKLNIPLHKKLATAVEDERRRISMDFHDDLVGSLSGLLGEIYIVRQKIRSLELPEISELMERIVASMQFNIEQVRRIIFALLPPSLESRSLDFNVSELCTRMGTVEGKIHYSTTGNPSPLTVEQKVHLYRIIQELLNNSKKHSKALNVYVSTSWSDTELKVKVRDDGRGFSINHVNNRKPGLEGRGLTGIVTRALLLGAQTKFNRPAKGIEFELTLPLPKKESGQAIPEGVSY